MQTATPTHIGRYPIGSSCPWKIVAPAQMTPIARTLDAAQTRPWLREVLAREAKAVTTGKAA